MRVLGIDPGYDRLGIAVVEKNSSKEVLVYSSCFTTSSKEDFEKRLLGVGNEIVRVLETYKPDVLSIESIFITKNQKTATKISEVRGVIIYEATKRNIPMYEYSPPEIKLAITGDGRSDKNQIMKMIPLLIEIKKGIETLDDEYDAIAVALTAIACLRPDVRV